MKDNEKTCLLINEINFKRDAIFRRSIVWKAFIFWIVVLVIWLLFNDLNSKDEKKYCLIMLKYLIIFIRLKL